MPFANTPFHQGPTNYVDDPYLNSYLSMHLCFNSIRLRFLPFCFWDSFVFSLRLARSKTKEFLPSKKESLKFRYPFFIKNEHEMKWKKMQKNTSQGSLVRSVLLLMTFISEVAAMLIWLEGMEEILYLIRRNQDE